MAAKTEQHAMRGVVYGHAWWSIRILIVPCVYDVIHIEWALFRANHGKDRGCVCDPLRGFQVCAALQNQVQAGKTLLMRCSIYSIYCYSPQNLTEWTATPLGLHQNPR